jgi:hypothetical protein
MNEGTKLGLTVSENCAGNNRFFPMSSNIFLLQMTATLGCETVSNIMKTGEVISSLLLLLLLLF